MQSFFSNNNTESSLGPGYGADINIPVYATVKGVSFFLCPPASSHTWFPLTISSNIFS